MYLVFFISSDQCKIATDNVSQKFYYTVHLRRTVHTETKIIFWDCIPVPFPQFKLLLLKYIFSDWSEAGSGQWDSPGHPRQCSQSQNVILVSVFRIRIRIGSGFKQVSGSVSEPESRSGSGSRRAKFFMFWSAICSLLRAEGFFCSVRYGGLGIGKLQFLINLFFLITIFCWVRWLWRPGYRFIIRGGGEEGKMKKFHMLKS